MNPSISVTVGGQSLKVSMFCFEKVGNTDNMKFRITFEDGTVKEFDDFLSVEEAIGQILFGKLISEV